MVDPLELNNVKIPLFDGISDSQLLMLFGHLLPNIRKYEKDEIIIMEEEQIRYVGIVLEGRVNMIREDLWGETVFITYMKPGELFGETFHIMRQKQSGVTFQAAEKTKVLFLSLNNIMHPCSHNCPFHVHLADNLYDQLGKRNVQFIEKIEVISKPDLRGKILAYLEIQAEKQGSSRIDIPLNREEMAEYLCANRSALSRELAALKDEGVIDYQKNHFRLLKPVKE